MKSRRIWIGLAAGIVFASLCICAAAIGFGAYYGFGDRVEALISDPVQVIEDSVVLATEPSPTETPFGADIDLRSLFSPVWEARNLLRENFVEQPVDDAVLAQGALDGLTTMLDELGVDIEAIDLPTAALSPQSLAEEAETPDEAVNAFLPYFDLWGQVEYANLEGLTSYEDLMRGSLSGMVAALGDEHTSYLDPQQLQQADLSLDGEYEGIGAWVDPTSEYLTIIAPMEGSPAEAAGLKPGDIVIAIDGDDMTGMDGNAVISRILGPAGSVVVLTIQREVEEAPFDVSVERAAIFVPSVVGEMLEEGIGYIQLTTFGITTSAELENAIRDLLEQTPSGLILDLRNNGGGYLQTSVEVSSQFLSEGIVLHEEFGDGSQQTYDVLNNGLATDINMVVLVNGGSASASEIVAGALQDQGRAILIGETTFGKGSVQVSPALSDNEGALRITVAHWLTPEGRQIHGLGLEPDIVVERTEADFEADLDPQLDAAIDYLIN